MNFVELLKIHKKLKVRLWCGPQDFVGVVGTVSENCVCLETVYYNAVNRTFLRTDRIDAIEEVKELSKNGPQSP